MLGKTVCERYQIDKKLGQGAFGTTFLAQDTKRLGNPQCVVKHLTPQNTDPGTLQEAKRLFKQEAEILETLGKHDQIPQLLAYCEENQEFYLVQEYIEGHDLSEELSPEGKQLSETEVIKLLDKILEVLSFVHQYNVIHRDIKPSNLRRRQDGKIVLIDFGAVKQISTQVVNTQGQRSFTFIVGTPGYMPSEQAKGNPKPSSDVYAVGIIGIQALTGISPNQLQTDVNTGEIIWRDHVKVSPKLANILDKMVRYDFRQRYQSATDTLQALKQLSFKYPLKKALIGVGIAALITILLVLPRFITPREDILTYTNPSYGIKIKYPETWQKQDIENPVTAEVVTFLSPKEGDANKLQEKLTISVENFSGTLKESTNSFISEINQHLPEAKIIEQGSTTLASKAAKQLVYTGKDAGNNVKNMQVWTLKADKVYVITYTAQIDDYDKFIQTAQKMINSFEIN